MKTFEQLMRFRVLTEEPQTPKANPGISAGLVSAMRDNKPKPAPAIAERLSGIIRTADDDSPTPGAFQGQDNFEPGAPTRRFQRLLGGKNQLVRQNFARLNENLDWGNLNPNDPAIIQRVQDYGANQLFYAQQLNEDLEQDDIPTNNRDVSLSYDEVQALMANRERNLALYGSNVEQGRFQGRPDVEKTRLISESYRPFKFTPDFVESSYNLMRRVHALKDAWGGIGGVNQRKDVPEARMKGLLEVINSDLLEEDDEPIKASELKKIFEDIIQGNEYKKPEPELFKGGAKRGQEKPKSARLSRVHDLVQMAMKHESLGEEFRREEDDSNSAHNDMRSRIVWKLWLEQAGREALTGLPLNPRRMQLEHYAPTVRNDLNSPDDEILDRFQQVDSDQNYGLLNESINLAKSDMDMETFYKTIVEPLSEITPEQFASVGQLRSDASRELNSFVDDVMTTFMADGNFATPESAAQLMSSLEEVKEKIGNIADSVYGNLDEQPIAPKAPKAPNSNAREFKPITMPATAKKALENLEKGKTLTAKQEEALKVWQKETTPINEKRAAALQAAQDEYEKAQKEYDDFDMDDFNKRLNSYNQRRNFFRNQGRDKINNTTKDIAKQLLKRAFNVGVGGHDPGRGSMQYGPARLDRVLNKFLSDPAQLDQNKQLWETGLSNGNKIAKLRDQLKRGELEGEDLETWNELIQSANLNVDDSPATLARKYMDYYLDSNGF